MKIYWVEWTSFGGFLLSAVVVAESQEEALVLVGLAEFERADRCEEVGAALPSRFAHAQLLAAESL